MMNQNRLTRTLTATARRLYEKGDEVLVIDIDSNRINMVPTATYVLKDSDILIVLGSPRHRGNAAGQGLTATSGPRELPGPADSDTTGPLALKQRHCLFAQRLCKLDVHLTSAEGHEVDGHDPGCNLHRL
jgi:hypothetical protein